MPSNAIDALFEVYGPRYRAYVTFTAMLGTISAVLTATMINVAIPDVMGAFGIGQDQAQWLSTGFLAAMTIAMLLNDWCVRAFGMRNTYLGAMSIFALGSVIGGIGTSLDLVILGRVLQGSGAGLVQPLSMVIMFRVFPAHQRGRAMGLFGMGVVLAPALGPALGGLLVDFYNWRAVFVAAVPVSSTGMLLAMLFMPQREGSGPRPGFDWIGLILMCLFIGNLLLGLSNGQRAGWESFQISSNFAIAILSAAAFVWWELKVEQPMFNLRIFASGGFTAAALVTVVFGSMLFGSTYLVPLFVQTVQGYTATRAGVLMIPAGLAMMAIFPLAGRLSDRGISPQLPILAGMLVFSFATYLMVAGDTNTPFLTFAFWLLLSRIGLSMVMPNLTVSAMRALTPEMVSQGSGALNFMRQLGGAFGVNLLAINLERQTELYRAYFRASQTPENWMTDDLIREISRLFAEIGLPPLPSMASSFQFIESTILEQANMMAFRDDFLIVSLVSLAAIVPALFIGRTWRAKPAPHAPATP